MTMSTINVIGAGQCGSMIAIMLARRGHRVDLLERSADPRKGDAAAGRSINLALAARGLNALRRIGIESTVEPLLIPMHGRMVHNEDGSTEFLPYGHRTGEHIYSVTRSGLNQAMMDVADEMDEVDLRFNQGAMGYDAGTGVVNMQDTSTGKNYSVDAAPLIAADGAGSVIRRSLDEAGTFGSSETLLAHCYKELSIPAGPQGEFQLESDALHIWPRGGFMLIALPNPGGDFTLTLFLPEQGDISFSRLVDEASVVEFFDRHFSDAAELIPNLVDEALNNPLGQLGTIRCRHWHDRDRVLLLGDAAHAIVPFHGQGMNLALEDCVTLDSVVAAGGDWSEIFADFEAKQRRNANAIADMALENYIEMRDTVRDPKFALRKELAFELERRRPDHFIPRYSMVMFHADIPYSVAQERGEIQKVLLERFTADAETLSEVDVDAAVAAVANELPPIDSVRNDLSAPSTRT